MSAVSECLARLRELRDQGFEFEKRSYPIRTSNADEQYSIVEWTSTGAAPQSFMSAFGPARGYKTAIGYSEVAGIQALLEFVKQQPTLETWLVPSRFDEPRSREHHLSVGVAEMPLEIVDRHIHTAGWDLDEETAIDIYNQLEAWWLESDLPVELWIPILGINFEVDEFELGDGAHITRMGPGEQLARWPGMRLKGQESLVAMATHALVLPGWTIANEFALQWMTPTDPPDHVPQAERFLESLAIVTNAPSGYVQVVMKPVGWAPGYVADLPVMLAGALVPDKRSTRLRPESEPLVSLHTTELEQLRATYQAVSKTKEVALAATRLLSAERRSDRADRIVDLCVGLEALLSDSQGETTYKIAMRAAAMLAKSGEPSPSSFIEPMKTVYAHRSAVVHGRGSDKTAVITIEDRSFPTETLARKILGALLQVRIANPSLNPQGIDRQLLGAALDQFSVSLSSAKVTGEAAERTSGAQ